MKSEIKKVHEFTSDSEGERLDSWLADNLSEQSRTYIKKLIEDGNVTVNQFREKPNYRLKKGDRINVVIPVAKKLEVRAEKIDIDIIYEDNDIIVIDKPKNMVVHPAPGNYDGTLVNALMYRYQDSLSDINGKLRPGIVHRLDKDTTGVLVVARNNKAHKILSEKFKEHDINRVYTAVVHNVINEDRGKIDAPLGRHPVDRKKMAVNTKNGKRAVTHFKVIERFNSSTLVELRLETGRTHQIRVHMAYIGHYVAGDETYGGKQTQSFYGVSSQALHASLLGFTHPSSDEYVEFSSKLPEQFSTLLDKLRQNK